VAGVYFDGDRFANHHHLIRDGFNDGRLVGYGFWRFHHHAEDGFHQIRTIADDHLNINLTFVNANDDEVAQAIRRNTRDGIRAGGDGLHKSIEPFGVGHHQRHGNLIANGQSLVRDWLNCWRKISFWRGRIHRHAEGRRCG